MESEAVVVHPIRSFQQNQHVGLEIFSTLCSNVAKADLPKRLRWNMQLATSQSALYHNEEHDHAHTNSISRAHLDLKPISSEKKLPTVRYVRTVVYIYDELASDGGGGGASSVWCGL